jgi:hypothetical protein
MSANRWSICPRCLKRFEAAKAKAAEELKKSYGKVPPNDYLVLVQMHEKDMAREIEYSLREDYWQGINNETGEYEVTYSGVCQECDYTFQFNHKVQTKT